MSTGNPVATDEIEYPDSDGEPMSDNTLQWDWMVKIVSELRVMFAGQNVFVAGDLLWYPIKGDPKTRLAPDGLVAFGRPPGYRGSYQQWKEDNIAPQVVFEVLSPKNTLEEMIAKEEFYERFGVEEFYIIDPYEENMEGYIRIHDKLTLVKPINGYVSPRLGIKFLRTNEGLLILTPDGREFQTREEHVAELYNEIDRANAEIEAARLQTEAERERADSERERADGEKERADTERERAEAERERAEAERERAEAERERAEAERERAEAERERANSEQRAKELFIAKLRELGLNPDDILDRRN